MPTVTAAQLRPVERQEIDAYAACQGSAFSGRYTSAELESLAEELPLDRSVAAFDDGDIVATTALVLSDMTETVPVRELATKSSPLAGS